MRQECVDWDGHLQGHVLLGVRLDTFFTFVFGLLFFFRCSFGFSGPPPVLSVVSGRCLLACPVNGCVVYICVFTAVQS